MCAHNVQRITIIVLLNYTFRQWQLTESFLVKFILGNSNSEERKCERRTRQHICKKLKTCKTASEDLFSPRIQRFTLSSRLADFKVWFFMDIAGVFLTVGIQNGLPSHQQL